MSRYVIEFAKTGPVCYTSHLDLMRIFKRAFKRTGIMLAYSQGFNPHPKMGFAQPLSLGYESRQEYIEFETAQQWECGSLMERIAPGLPEGIDLLRCFSADKITKTLASHTIAAEYEIVIPLNGQSLPGDPRQLWHLYMDRDKIEALKRQKKKKEPKLVDIRPMIRDIAFFTDVLPGTAGANLLPGTAGAVLLLGTAGADLLPGTAGADLLAGTAGADLLPGTAGAENPSGEPEGVSLPEAAAADVLRIQTVLDSGSASNLSPELVITTVLERFGLSVDRSEIDVTRLQLFFDQPL